MVAESITWSAEFDNFACLLRNISNLIVFEKLPLFYTITSILFQNLQESTILKFFRYHKGQIGYFSKIFYIHADVEQTKNLYCNRFEMYINLPTVRVLNVTESYIQFFYFNVLKLALYFCILIVAFEILTSLSRLDATI